MDTPHTQFGTSDSVSYVNEAVYAQGVLRDQIANVTVGARFEHHSEFGNSIVPRVAVTKVYEPMHVKLLYSEAFRAPGFENINLAPDPAALAPERTRVVEAELGYSIDAHNFVTFNGYWLRINKTIVYLVNEDGSEGYQNFAHTGTLGVEAVYKLRYKWGYFTASYAYYAAQDNEVPTYAVAGHPQAMLGIPQHKFAVHGAYNVWKNLRLAPSLVVTSRPYAFDQPNDGMGVGTLVHADRTALVNLFASYRDLAVEGLEVGIGVHNLLDRANNYYQPYDGGHSPMRGPARQLLLRVGYTRPL
jgi:outer membrane cobalamin receptor